MEMEEKPTILGKIIFSLKDKLLIVLIGFLTICFLSLIFLSHIFASNKSLSIFITPLGIGKTNNEVDLLLANIKKSKSTDNFPRSSYFPVNLKPNHEKIFDIDVIAYAVMDLDSKELLYGKNLTQELAIASVAKVMTSLVTLENIPLDTILTVSPYASHVGEATMGLTEKEKYTVEELLYGVILPSGNDAAETLAEGVGKYKKGIPLSGIDGGGAREWFISEMNKKAQELGMMDTYFFNPCGLDGDTKLITSFSSNSHYEIQPVESI